jgi:hypothetical protein
MQCRPCDWDLYESAYEPVSFDLEASLNLEGIMENDIPADELVYQLTQVPMATIGGVVQCPCGEPDEFTDPAAYPALTIWFMQKLVHIIHLDMLEQNSVDSFPAGPMYNITIPVETLSYRIVSDLSMEGDG